MDEKSHAERTKGQSCGTCAEWTGGKSPRSSAWCPKVRVNMHRFGWCKEWRIK